MDNAEETASLASLKLRTEELKHSAAEDMQNANDVAKRGLEIEQGGGRAAAQNQNQIGWEEMDTFDQAMCEVGEAYRSAKETMSSQGKYKYEAAKDRMSKATGALGDKMRRDVAEV